MLDIMSFEDRGKAFETKFALDEETDFKIRVKTNHLVAQWAADRIGLDEHQSAKFVAELDALTLVPKGTSKFKERLLSDFSANKIDISENALDKLFALKQQIAAKQVLKTAA